MIKVLVIDDSALMRRLLSHMLSFADDIEVVGTAQDAYQAREQIKKLLPDVITLDIEMPKMDGLSFLSNLMRLRPMPVVMVSSLTEKGAAASLEAIALGAVDFIAKPKNNHPAGLALFQDYLIHKVRGAACAKFAKPNLQIPMTPHQPALSKLRSRLIAIGASTGGIEAIQHILQNMPLNCPPIVITQHIPPVFSSSFAKRLNLQCSIKVIEAKGAEKLTPGHAYIAPGDQHLTIDVNSNGEIYTKLVDSDPVNLHKPSVDMLFNSVAQQLPKTTIGIILTGMGQDGSEGLYNLHQAGAYTIAQDQPSSVVWGMPGAAVARGACNEQLPLNKISQRIINLLTIADKHPD
ncbi:chemotaxis response regulator protein-glutamate methylesterase [Shewanella intestini]|uniref:Protein-glutamate methylesterase/protein-glutamine glutaminase n=1 Tax=Shewanella intestini TaxID=2017544 RepID=A0ABS5I210_9GAMM|nr:MULTISPECIES: chemotaxis response regulator protein-glutamate methylesterase [Shewanella]MBR9728066.1 chemotaxis response regulator protein-glutamate methylesterase [Shewanella intestini]MRG36538.1 chemotaxis-specific protein-glutamate methyltransferase CheB [Shewanella sp. XMDDZSB0408]